MPPGKRKGDISINAGTAALVALRVAGDPAWRDKVRAALVTEGSVPLAAIDLGMDGARTLQRWLRQDPTLRAGITLAPKGWPRGQSRKPQGATKKK